MKRIGILGDIGSGKTYVAKFFGFPVFNADLEVAKIYKNNKKVYKKLKNKLPLHFGTFPIKKKEIIIAILSNKKNLKKIIKIVHYEVRRKMFDFLKKNKHKKFVVLDIPLLLENKINKKKDILIFVQSKKSEIIKRLNKRKNFNMKIFKNFQKIQLSLDLKKKRSQFTIKNNFKKNSVKLRVRKIIKNLI